MLVFKVWTKICIRDTNQDMHTSYRYGNPKTLEIGSGRKLFITFLSLRSFNVRRERHNFFNKRAAQFVDPNWSRFGVTKN